MKFLHNTSTPQGVRPKLHSFWRGPYKITQFISEMTYKFCGIEFNKELTVHYDRIKPGRSPPGDFVPRTNTPPEPMQPENEIFFISSTAKCHFCFCEARITCTPTFCPVPASNWVLIVQSSLRTTKIYHHFCSLDVASFCSSPPVFFSCIQCPCATVCS